ncbi:esterase/lipase family protein [Methylobacterium indicum]|nr:alpha/beta hydrolase [Methylobacterium indicum]
MTQDMTDSGVHLPEKDQNNIWYKFSNSNTVIVFVHGVLSDSRSCWYDKKYNSYWPHLIAGDAIFGSIDIFLGGYYTAADAGRYEIRNAADELLSALSRGGEKSVLSKDRIIFVCHSTGGIVARYILVNNQDIFRNKTIGMVLLASPSLGSSWANKIGWITNIYGHSIGQQLATGHWTLREIDAQFKNLVNEQKIRKLVGVEAYENHFIIHRKWLPDKHVVVSEESAGRYFGAPVMLRKTDHFSCCKPTDRKHPSYELLSDFIVKYFGNEVGAFVDGTSQMLSFVFERRLEYPKLKFSIINNTTVKAQITSIRVFRVASAIDNHTGFEYFTGPRVQLEFDMKRAIDGQSIELLKDRITNLDPGEAEAFQVDIEAENLVSIIDFEVDLLTIGARKAKIVRPQDVLFLHSPTKSDKGQLVSARRDDVFSALLSEREFKVWHPSSYSDCDAHSFVMLRSAATLGLKDPERSWNELRNKYEGRRDFGFILASYADVFQHDLAPESCKLYIEHLFSDPNKIRELPATDHEPVALTISRALQASGRVKLSANPTASLGSSTYEIEMMDRLLEVDPSISDSLFEYEDHGWSVESADRLLGFASAQLMKENLLRKIADEHGKMAIDFLIAMLVIQPQLHTEIDAILAKLTGQEPGEFDVDPEPSVQRWYTPWSEGKELAPEQLAWQPFSPRLARAFAAFQATDEQTVALYVIDRDDVVRYAVARGSNLTSDHLHVLAHDGCPSIRLVVAQHKDTTIKILRRLAADKNSIVRRWTSKNYNADQLIIEQLRNDPSQGVRDFINYNFKDHPDRL